MTDDHKPLDGNTLPLGGSSANGSGGPPPAQRPECALCGDELVEQDDGRRFHLDGDPACRTPADAWGRKPPGAFGMTVPGARAAREEEQ